MAVTASTINRGSRQKFCREIIGPVFDSAIIASVATSLYNIIDSIFIGRGVGPMAIAGLAITFPLMNLVAAFCMLIARRRCHYQFYFSRPEELQSGYGCGQQCLFALSDPFDRVRWAHTDLP